jgi:hypothetical protein
MTDDELIAHEQWAAEWARTADFGPPLRWGEIEGEVLAHRLPPQSEEPGIAGLVQKVLLYGVPVLFLASPAIGLGLVLAAPAHAMVDSLWAVAAVVAFIAALAVAVTAGYLWVDSGRQRNWWALLLVGVVGACAVVALVQLRAQGEYRFVLGLCVGGAAAAGIGLFVTMLVASTGGSPRPKLPLAMRLNLDVEKELRYMAARRQVLEVLIERGLARVDEEERERMQAMKLGSWYQLDVAESR